MKAVFLCIFLFLIFLSGCAPSQKEPEAVQGIIDLSHWDISSNAIALNGDWKFYPGKPDSIYHSPPSYLEVPFDWSQQTGSVNTSGTYFLTVKLNRNKSDLALKVLGISSAYILEVNGSFVDSVGVFSTDRSQSHPAYERNIYPVKAKDSLLTIALKVCNYEHHEGGILQPLILGSYQKMSDENSYYKLIGGIIIGICLINGISYLIFFFFMREAKFFLHYALYLLIIGVHILCLSDRVLYKFLAGILGKHAWLVAYKVELFTIFAAIAAMFFFYDSLFNGILKKKLLWGFCLVLLVQGIFVLGAPAPLFTYTSLFIPYNLVISFTILIFILIKASKQNMQGSATLLVFNILLVGLLAHENFIFKKHVGDLHLFHIMGFVYITGISIVLIRKIIQSFAYEKELTSYMASTKEKLEQQNISLEKIVSERTQQLMEAEKQSYQLKIEKKERDMDTLVANNLVKLQISQNLIDELENLPKAEKELQPALNALITRLKGQVMVEEKLEVLQRDMDRINAEFYERLKNKFPDLSKTERELCAFIKLNLSNKDIAELRKTTVNTINVTRSRLRKKLGLERDEELESFIQQF